MKTLFLLCFYFCFICQGFSQGDTQAAKNSLIQLDLGWEKALLSSDVSFLETLLADDFIWVHNHAGMIDGKKEVLARAKRIQGGQVDNTKGRVSSDQKVVILGQTGIVSGYTVVDRGPSPTRYHFMRTYTWLDGKWKLLGNHTMAIPEEE
ncbi:nuclear transport factor 2 family protein [Algoriphagus taiwanensis]|uniref:DUF4440 domain-containing protein n=1 Tax=Algoriphagus taiwanensis TaxID=1445656 RepID=A0ABQ6Q703_9BACT|nr:hypothetical protein Ataiwa_30500 [Algoriphagus taiwanensis]